MELLSAIQGVIPSEGNIFVGLGKDRYIGYVIPEFVVPEAMSLFVDHAQIIEPREMVLKNLAWFQHGQRIMDNPEMFWEGFYRSHIYNLVWRPYNQHHCMQVLVGDNHAESGLLHLFRPRFRAAFSESEKNQFKQLLPYVEHGLRARNNVVTDYAEGGETGMFIIDNQGRLVFASTTARRLLALARYHSYPIGKFATAQNVEIPDALRQLCRNLNGIFQGRQAAPPVIVHINPLGRFVFSAHWLDPLNREPGGLVGVTVAHEEPTALRLLRGLKTLPLSPVQMEVCLLLAQNHSQDSIAQRLHIKLTTVKDHVRKIYGKLGIHQRAELLERLTAKTEIPR